MVEEERSGTLLIDQSKHVEIQENMIVRERQICSAVMRICCTVTTGR